MRDGLPSRQASEALSRADNAARQGSLPDLAGRRHDRGRFNFSRILVAAERDSESASETRARQLAHPSNPRLEMASSAEEIHGRIA